MYHGGKVIKKKPGLHRQEILLQSAHPRLSIQDPSENHLEPGKLSEWSCEQYKEASAVSQASCFISRP